MFEVLGCVSPRGRARLHGCRQASREGSCKGSEYQALSEKMALGGCANKQPPPFWLVQIARTLKCLASGVDRFQCNGEQIRSN